MLTLNYKVYYSICNFLPKLSENTQKVRHDLLVLVSSHNLYSIEDFGTTGRFIDCPPF